MQIGTLNWVVMGAMLIAGVVQLLPLVGVSGKVWLGTLYGITVDDEVVILLLRHRAVLLALVGVILITGAFVPSLRASALAVGLVSKLSFVLLHAVTSTSTPQVARVAMIDVATSALLAVAVALMAFAGWQREA